MDVDDKCALIARYYPYATQDEAAAILKMDRSTLKRHEAVAISRLVQRATRTGLFYGGENECRSK